ncbi:MAG: hypothetical protein IJI38_08975, partial [Clostridia bacterium]|nr:hypothetical protein [Clostridia bacterium]
MKKSLNWIKVVSLAVACVMLGAGLGLWSQSASATEAETVVITSPFTQAIADVKDSVVGVRNYQMVRYSNGSNDWNNYFGFGGWPFGNYGYGDRYGNDYGNNQQTTQEVLAGTGSGVVIAPHYVLTNYHVVEDASSCRTLRTGRRCFGPCAAWCTSCTPASRWRSRRSSSRC